MHKTFGPLHCARSAGATAQWWFPDGWTDAPVADCMQPFCVAKGLLELRGGVHLRYVAGRNKLILGSKRSAPRYPQAHVK